MFSMKYQYVISLCLTKVIAWICTCSFDASLFMLPLQWPIGFFWFHQHSIFHYFYQKSHYKFWFDVYFGWLTSYSMVIIHFFSLYWFKNHYQVLSLFPSAQGLEVTWSSVVKIGQSLYREGPGKDPFRPDQKTPVKNFFLAGSYTKQASSNTLHLLD